MADCSKLTAEFYAERLSMLQANEYGSYFSSMFSGEKQRYLDQLVLGSEELSAIDTEVLFVHGIQDQMVPFGEVTLPLVRSIRNADALLLGNCGHGPALEQPAKFLGAVRRLFG
jgi:2-hydroxymuconate-semialdehyde hydrolase